MRKYGKILIVGGGGREHAIGWKVAQSSRAGELFFAPGNAGTLKLGTNVNVAATDIPKLIEFAKKEKVDLTLALSDDPLALGIVDRFKEEGLRIWGPSKAAAELEWSKSFAKEFMKRHGVPTSRYEVFSDFKKAKEYVQSHPLPIVVKADGLAFGKGVTICETREKAQEVLKQILIDKIFGNSGKTVVVEEFLEGIEFSVHAVSDGKTWKMFPSSQDHKRIFEGNRGPNTGGMGVIAPLPFISEDVMKKIEREIVAKVINGMREEGRPFAGCLYPGVMLTKEGPKVFEINSRFGDPEAQTYMRILKSDFLDIADACIDGTLGQTNIEWEKLSACNIAVASAGYPGAYEKGKEIHLSPDFSPDRRGAKSEVVIFHAGTKINEDGKLVTNGGRVLGVSATGDNLDEALNNAYQAIEKISFEGMQYRRDIGKQAIELSKNK